MPRELLLDFDTLRERSRRVRCWYRVWFHYARYVCLPECNAPACLLLDLWKRADANRKGDC